MTLVSALPDLSSSAVEEADQIILRDVSAGAIVKSPLGGVIESRVRLMGWRDWADTTTAGTPITVAPSTWVNLTNDGAGTYTNTAHGLPGTNFDWSVASQVLNFTQYQVGDTVDLRVDANITTTGANQIVKWRLYFNAGGSPFSLESAEQLYKTSGAKHVVQMFSFYLGSDDVKDSTTRIQVWSDSDATLVVNGFFIRVVPKFPVWVPS